MEASISQSSRADRLLHEAPAEAWLTARRPILDVHNDVRSYELLVRRGNSSAPSAEKHGPASDDAIRFIERLGRGQRALVRCAPDTLLSDDAIGLPFDRTILEIAADAEPTAELIQACRKLKSSGYGLALDGFPGDAGALAGLADYIGVDFSAYSAPERQKLIDASAAAPATLIAKNIETQEQFRQAKAEGFDLFEGYYFLQPEPGAKQQIPGNKLVHLEILELMQSDPYDLHRLSQLVSCDADLTYRLLRLVNSPIAAIRQEITSIQAALIMVGQNAFRRISTVAIVSDLNPDKPAEILRMALARGRFCELSAELCGLNPAEQYLIGMVSLFPAMLGTPIEQLAPMLPLRTAVCDALCGRPVPEAALLKWAFAIERGIWSECDEIAANLRLPQSALMQSYGESIAWAEVSLTSMA